LNFEAEVWDRDARSVFGDIACEVFYIVKILAGIGIGEIGGYS